MGIRVDCQAMEAQLKHRGMLDRAGLAYHRAVISGALPLCMGGGIGISRLLMLLLQRGHIGEVQVTPSPNLYEVVACCAVSSVTASRPHVPVSTLPDIHACVQHANRYSSSAYCVWGVRMCSIGPIL